MWEVTGYIAKGCSSNSNNPGRLAFFLKPTSFPERWRRIPQGALQYAERFHFHVQEGVGHYANLVFQR
jgi:hypothetical protein